MPQILPAGLQLLRKPQPSLRSFQRLCNGLRMREHFTQILPDQFIELSGRNEAGVTGVNPMGSCTLSMMTENT